MLATRTAPITQGPQPQPHTAIHMASFIPLIVARIHAGHTIYRFHRQWNRTAAVSGICEWAAVSSCRCSVQPQIGDVARVLLEFAALNLLDDLDEPLVGAGWQPDLFALA